MRKITFLSLGLAALALLSCKENTTSLNAISGAVSSQALIMQKLDTLGSRYNQLGRFSGCIMVSEDGQVRYKKFFGKADYESEKDFREETTFAAGSLSELLLSAAREKLQIQDIDHTEAELQSALATLIAELSLENTFFRQQAPSNAATGYVHSIGRDGPVIQPVGSDQEIQLWINPADLKQLLQELPQETIQEEGYLENGGFSFSVRKKEDLIVVVLSNRRHPVAGEMAKSIEHLWNLEPYELPLLRKETRISPALLKEYAGSYQLGPGAELQVVSENDSLYVLMGPQKVILRPQSENQFFMVNSEAAIRFKRDSTGKIASAELLDGFLTGHQISKIH